MKRLVHAAFLSLGVAWVAPSSYWVNFAKSGNPNGAGLPPWAAFDGKTAQVMELGDQFRAIPLADAARVDFRKRYYAAQKAL